jgi:hypothetical protein
MEEPSYGATVTPNSRAPLCVRCASTLRLLLAHRAHRRAHPISNKRSASACSRAAEFRAIPCQRSARRAASVSCRATRMTSAAKPSVTRPGSSYIAMLRLLRAAAMRCACSRTPTEAPGTRSGLRESQSYRASGSRASRGPHRRRSPWPIPRRRRRSQDRRRRVGAALARGCARPARAFAVRRADRG